MTHKIHTTDNFSIRLTGLLLSICCALLMVVTHASANWQTPIMSEYIKVPPFVSNSIKPNVIVALDISGSMKAVAYRDTSAGNWRKGTHSDFDPDYKYYGYFDSSQNYAYDGAADRQFFYASATGDWNGNFLNWLCMRRMDIVRKVLTGGKVSMRVRDQRATSTTFGQEVPVNRHLARNAAEFGGAVVNWDGFYVLEGQNEPFDYSFTKYEANAASYIPATLAAAGVTSFVMDSGEIRPAAANNAVVPLGPQVEIGSVSVDWNETDREWTRVDFVNSYNQPRVVVKTPTFNGGNQMSNPRIKWDTPWPHTNDDHFWVRLQEWDYLDGNHTDETVSYMVVEADSGPVTVTMDNGNWIFQANSAQETVASANCGTSETYINIAWAGGLPATPVVFAGVGSYSDNPHTDPPTGDIDAIVTRIQNVSTASVDLIMQKEEPNGDSCTHGVTENIHAIAVVPPAGASTTIATDSFNGHAIQLGLINAAHSWTTITYDTSDSATSFDEAPLFMGDMQTINGTDPASVRVRNGDETEIELKVEEEKADDSETTHNAEVIGWFAVEGISPFKIRVGVQEEPTGILQDISADMRLGMAVYNYDHINKSPDEIYTGNKVHGGTFIPSYPDLSKANVDRTTTDIEVPCGVHDPVENIYRVIEQHPLIWGTTPIAETLVEIQRYIQQDGSNFSDPTGTGTNADMPGGAYYDNFTGIGGNANRPSYPLGSRDSKGTGAMSQDPYYYSEFDTPEYAAMGVDPLMECAQTFVLHFNDGAPYADWDDGHWSTLPTAHPTVTGDSIGAIGQNEMLDDVAYDIRRFDQRTDAELPGHQEIITYYVYAALGEGEQYNTSTRRMREAAANGGFVDGAGPREHLPDPAHKANMNTYITGGTLPNTETPQEWDADQDYNPDTFYYANDGYQLVQELTAAFQSILNRVSSGTAASVISNSRSGEGAIYQSIFYPTITVDTNTVNWVGQVHALLVDAYGNLREDSNNNQTLDPYVDRFVVFDDTSVYLYEDTNGNSRLDDAEAVAPVDTIAVSELNYLWSTNDWLNEMADPVSQRLYGTTSQQRHIITFVDEDGDMVADPNEVQEFEAQFVPSWAQMTDTGNFFAYLHTFSPYAPGVPTSHPDFQDMVTTQAKRMVDYIRGADQGQDTVGAITLDALRSRQIDWDEDGTVETWRMGDVVQSTPKLVSRPFEKYDLIFKDKSYTAFFREYRDRRNMIYVGANDGMLHAFNGGFFTAYDNSFRTQPYDVYGDPITDKTYHNFDLGAEVWAYVPFNLLPHLYWLTDVDYSHVYYNDLEPKIFDAKIFTPSPKHPEGWGTVLVGGMRFGGGKIAADLDKTDGAYNPNVDRAMSSAYYILDITDPEEPPVVMAEITFPDLGYTTCFPAVVPIREKQTFNTFDANQWYLMIGSGPNGAGTDGPDTGALKTGESQQNAVMYAIDLVELGRNGELWTVDSSGVSRQYNPSNAGPYYLTQFPEANSSVSEPISVDWALDFSTDVVYFGLSHGDHTNGWGGKMRRIVLQEDNDSDPTDPANWELDSTLIDLPDAAATTVGNGQPIVAAATAGLDTDHQRWIYFGTGRYYSQQDGANTDQQSYYGIKEPYGPGLDFDYSEVFRNNLEDVTDATVNVDLSVQLGASTLSFESLVTQVDNGDGWVLDLSEVPNRERNLGQAVLAGDLVTFTSYVPSTDPCTIEGETHLYALYYLTGTAYFKSTIGTGGGGTVHKRISLGKGMSLTPNIHVGRQDGSRAYVQTSTGAIEQLEQDNPGRVKSGGQYWNINDSTCP